MAFQFADPTNLAGAGYVILTLVEKPYSEWPTHRYAQPGNYLITVKGKSTGAGPGIFHVRVIVTK